MDYKVSVSPVLTRAIKSIIKNYKEVKFFLESGGDERNLMRFFGEPSSLEAVYSSEETQDSSILKARATLQYWRELPSSSLDDETSMALYDESIEVENYIKNCSNVFPKKGEFDVETKKRVFRANKAIVEKVLDYVQSFGLYQEDNQKFTKIITRSLERIQELKGAVSKDYGILQRTLKSGPRRLDIENDPNCETWMIIVWFNGRPFGKIYVYHNDSQRLRGEKYIFMQYIALYPLPYLVKTIFPELNLPRLNSVLEEPINQIGIQTGSKYILVHPLERQSEIMIKHYGYRVEHDYFPLPGTSIETTEDRLPRLVKEVRRE